MAGIGAGIEFSDKKETDGALSVLNGSDHVIAQSDDVREGKAVV